MKVRPKHMAVISVGSLHLAIKQLGVLPIDTDDLVAISQVSTDLLFVRIIIHVYKNNIENWQSFVLRHKSPANVCL